MRKSRSGVVFFGDAARITLPGPDLGTGGELGVATGNTLPRIELGAVDELGGATGTTSPGSSLGAVEELGDSTGIELTSAPVASWVVPLEPLH